MVSISILVPVLLVPVHATAMMLYTYYLVQRSNKRWHRHKPITPRSFFVAPKYASTPTTPLPPNPLQAASIIVPPTLRDEPSTTPSVLISPKHTLPLISTTKAIAQEPVDRASGLPATGKSSRKFDTKRSSSYQQEPLPPPLSTGAAEGATTPPPKRPSRGGAGGH